MTRGRTMVVLLLGAVVALVAGVGAYRASAPDRAAAPHPAADLFYAQTFGDADGTTRSMADLRGKVVLVNFWATWCVPCVREIPAFLDGQQRRRRACRVSSDSASTARPTSPRSRVA